MDIKEYIQKNTTQAEFAALIGVSVGLVYQWLKEIRPISIEKCVEIEQKTKGVLNRKHLRPNDWQKIWPELIQQENI